MRSCIKCCYSKRKNAEQESERAIVVTRNPNVRESQMPNPASHPNHWVDPSHYNGGGNVPLQTMNMTQNYQSSVKNGHLSQQYTEVVPEGPTKVIQVKPGQFRRVSVQSSMDSSANNQGQMTRPLPNVRE